MKIVFTLVVIFIMAFLFVFSIVYRANKEEKVEERMNGIHITIVSFMIALLPTIVIAVILFALFGSANVVNELFSLKINLNKVCYRLQLYFIYGRLYRRNDREICDREKLSPLCRYVICSS